MMSSTGFQTGNPYNCANRIHNGLRTAFCVLNSSPVTVAGLKSNGFGSKWYPQSNGSLRSTVWIAEQVDRWNRGNTEAGAFLMVGFRLFVFGLLGVAFGAATFAQPVAPSFSSRPGATYTLYLNFAGFNYTGNWGSGTPGITPAYNGQTGSAFTSSEQANIKNIWARVAESYSPFNVNVTTIDPAVAAGQAGSHSQRQTYYDATARLQHTVIGAGSSTFYGSAGGVSYVNVWATPQTSGRGTNWVFTNRLGGYNAFHNIFTATSHENGHAASLSHQGDYIGTTSVNSYSRNNNSPTLAPIMGVGYSASRNVWREGRVNTTMTTIHNDVQRILNNNAGMTLVNDGIGRTMLTATPLALIGQAIDFLNAKGIIVSASSTNAQPIGESNYTKGYFSFSTVGGFNTITVNAGGQWITPGVADPDAMLDATLRLLDSTGSLVAESATDSLSETIGMNLAAGTYFVEVSSAGGKFASLGPAGTWHAASFYDMGSYFLTGSIMSVPEPGSFAMFLAIVGLMARHRHGRVSASP